MDDCLTALAMNCLVTALAFAAVLCAAIVSALDIFSDSGINYTEVVQTIQNPGAGYTSTKWCYPSPGKTGIYQASGSLVMYFIDIGAFSSGMNGEKLENGTRLPGTDYPFDDLFFTNWRKSLDYARQTGSMVGMRFRYDSNGVSNPEPATFDALLSHIRQLKDSRLFEDYKDIIALLESGFVGAWGEQHSGKYTSVQYKAQLLDVLLNSLPESIPITVRTPDIFAQWAGVRCADLNNSEIFEKARNSTDPQARRVLTRRVGVFNDGYMGTNIDYGTFHNREIETNWIGYVTPETYYGGEFSGNLDLAQKYDTYLPKNAIPEMYKTHLSYIHGNIFPFYRNFTFTRDIDTVPADNSAYYGRDAFTFIRDHLGYRFVLRKSELTNWIKQGDILKLRFKVENTGFSAPVPHTRGYILLEKDDVYIKAPIDLDTHYWNSCATIETKLSVKIPDNIKTGRWNVYLKEVMGGYSNEITELSLRSIRFANERVWKSVLGANFLGWVEISESDTHGADNNLYAINSDGNGAPSDEFLRTEVKPVVDGMISYDHEWTKDMLIAKGENKTELYVRADEAYLYIMARLPTTAKSPVYNARMVFTKNEKESFWTYAGIGTAPYYNHGNYSGCQCKWNNGMVEFRLPYTWLTIRPDQLQFVTLSVSQQDSSVPGWGSFGRVSLDNFSISADVTHYSVEKDMIFMVGENYTLKVRTYVEGVKYQWLKDGTPLDNGSRDVYQVVNASSNDKGKFSVVLTTRDGGSKEVLIANVLDVISPAKSSAIELSSANLVLFSKWLLTVVLVLMLLI